MIDSLFSSNLIDIPENQTDDSKSTIGDSVDLVKDLNLDEILSGDSTIIESRGIELAEEKESEDEQSRKNKKEDSSDLKNQVTEHPQPTTTHVETNKITESETNNIIQKTIEKIEPLIFETASAIVQPVVLNLTNKILEPLVFQSATFIKESNRLIESQKDLIESISSESNSTKIENGVFSTADRILTETDKVKETKEKSSERTNEVSHESGKSGENITNHSVNTLNDVNLLENRNTYSIQETLQNNPVHLESINTSDQQNTEVSNNSDLITYLERNNLELTKPKEKSEDRVVEIQTAFEGAIKNIQTSSPGTMMFIKEGGNLVTNSTEKEKTIEKKTETNNTSQINAATPIGSNEIMQTLSMHTALLSMIHETLNSPLKVKINQD